MLSQTQHAAHYFLDWNLQRIIRCVEVLDKDQIWSRPNNNSLSVGNQILHLAGNIRQWGLHGLGGKEDVRIRDEEFAAEGGVSAEELVARLTGVIEEAKLVVADLTKENMLRERDVQAYRHNGVFILMHVVEHLSYHTGQIIFYTKAVLNIDLDFYGDVDLTKKGA
ncbi:MAG: putative damage-inducible protein DinB [Neolewinella sp.]|jgi:uncharacterized damage-inducible protein DinB